MVMCVLKLEEAAEWMYIGKNLKRSTKLYFTITIKFCTYGEEVEM